MYKITPLPSPIEISQKVPGSKSITNRVLLISALSDGKNIIKGSLQSDDTKYMKDALKKLGIKIETLKNEDEIVYGKKGILKDGDMELFVGNAGTAMRFLTPLMALRKGKTILTGNKRMCKRPIYDLVDGLKQLDVNIKNQNDNGCPPLIIEGSGELLGGLIQMKGNVSSQYFSALMLAAPLASDTVRINVIGNLVSKPYVNITIRIMKDFGVDIMNDNYKNFTIHPQKYSSQRKYQIEGDASSASYWFAFAALTGSSVTVENVYYDSPQGDIEFAFVLEKMGCQVIKNEDYSITVKGQSMLKGLGEINVNHIPDAAMTLAILASAAYGNTTLRGLENLKVKETNRLKALTTEFNKIGSKVTELPDGLEIEGNPFSITAAEIDTYNDHRMAMCFAILGTKFEGITIKNPECVNKTYPNFWKDLEKNGVELEEV